MLGALNSTAMHSPRKPPVHQGLTMVELMITLAIGAILLALAIPQMRELIARKRVAGTAAELASDIKFARAMVLQQNRAVWVKFGSTGDFSCYVLFLDSSSGGECDCTRTSTPMCGSGILAPIPIRSVFIQRNTGITLTSAAQRVIYKQATGEPTLYGGSAEAEISGNVGGRLKVVMGGLTRATICSLSGHTAEFGDCP